MLFMMALVFNSCNNKEQIYTITDYYIENYKNMGVEEVQKLINDDRNDCLGTKLILSKYDDSIMLRILSGKTHIAKEISDMAYKKINNNLYTLDERNYSYELFFKGNKIIVKEIVKTENDLTIVFVLTKD